MAAASCFVHLTLSVTVQAYYIHCTLQEGFPMQFIFLGLILFPKLHSLFSNFLKKIPNNSGVAFIRLYRPLNLTEYNIQ